MSEARRQIRRVHIEDVGLQIAPMIDVTLLLLFFFMLTGKLTKGEKLMNIGLPTAAAVLKPDDVGDRDVVNIDDRGQFFTGDRLVTEKELSAHLKERFKNYPPLKLYVRADSKTVAQKIKRVMALASEAGAIEVVFGVIQD